MLKYFTLFLFLASCHSEKPSSPNKTGKSELQKSLIGQWGSASKGRPTFDITQDSIYHFGNKKSLPYILKGNDMVITENGIPSTYYNVRVFGDTLLFESPRGYEMAGIRFKEYYPH